jgi:hypothetical protein
MHPPSRTLWYLAASLVFVAIAPSEPPVAASQDTSGARTSSNSAGRAPNDPTAPGKPVRFIREWGQHGSEPGEFDAPIGVAINKADDVFVTDHYNHRVQKFDSNGKLLAHFGVLPNPGGIAIMHRATSTSATFQHHARTRNPRPTASRCTTRMASWSVSGASPVWRMGN